MSKIRTKRKGKNFFITGSGVSGLVNKTTVSSSIFEQMSQSFADGEHLLDDAIREPNAGILFMLQQMQDDMDDIYTQISASQYAPLDNSQLQATTGSFTTLTVDDITIDGSTISDGGDFTLDVEGDITLDANGADIILSDDGTDFGRFKRDSSDFIIKSETNNKDIVFRGQDGGATITALTLDMSEAGSATFNNHITASGNISSSGTILANGFKSNGQTVAALVNDQVRYGNANNETKIFADNTITLGNSTSVEGHITASGNISCSGDYIGNIVQIYNANFQDDLGTSVHYVPIGTNNFEQITEDADEVGFVAPYDGELVKIIYRHNFDASSTTTRWTFTKIADGTDLNGLASAIFRATITGATTDDIKEITIADSDVGGLESAPFSKGDTIFLSVRNASDVTTTASEFHVTVVLKFNIPLGLI